MQGISWFDACARRGKKGGGGGRHPDVAMTRTASRPPHAHPSPPTDLISVFSHFCPLTSYVTAIPITFSRTFTRTHPRQGLSCRKMNEGLNECHNLEIVHQNFAMGFKSSCQIFTAPNFAIPNFARAKSPPPPPPRHDLPLFAINKGLSLRIPSRVAHPRGRGSVFLKGLGGWGCGGGPPPAGGPELLEAPKKIFGLN